MNPLDRLLIGCILAAALLIGGVQAWRHYGAEQFKAGRADAIAERKAADDAAVEKRTKENAAEAVRQVGSNATITEKKHEEIAPVRERIVTQRVYVGTAVCGDRPSSATEAEGAGSGDGADPARRLVREDAERDIRALKLQVEEHLATARACQQVLQDEGMTP